jgi:hypothetical protein
MIGTARATLREIGLNTRVLAEIEKTKPVKIVSYEIFFKKKRQ